MAGNPSANIVIFAGAGASKAVDPKTYPTTVEFFERLPPEILEAASFRYVVDFLRRNDPDKVIDIEEVLWQLSNIRSFLKSPQTQDDIIGYSLNGDRLAHLISPVWSFGHLNNVQSELLPQLDALISSIHAIVYDLYGEAPTISSLGGNWTPLLRPLLKTEHHLDLFTTNYDINIESALEYIMRDKATDVFGVSGGRHKTIDLSQWEAKNADRRGLFTKLHGSVDWKVKSKKIYVGDPVFTGDHEKQGIIYPGFKGIGSAIFFKPFHDYLERRLARADFVAFIGFAFRDEYINESIRNNLAADAQVVVLNPDKSVRFPYGRAKVRYITKVFDSATATEISKSALSTALKRTTRAI